jgi:hypothetical protein
MTLQSTPPFQRNDAASNAEAGVRKVDAPNEYFMPTSSDGVVLAFRLWLNKYAGEELVNFSFPYVGWFRPELRVCPRQSTASFLHFGFQQSVRRSAVRFVVSFVMS